MLQTSSSKKDAENRDRITQFQFMRLYKIPDFSKVGSYFKADLEIVFKKLQAKHDCTALDIYGFFDSIEILS